MNRAHINIGSVSCSSSNLIDAKLEEHRMSGSKQCPSCGHKFNQKPDWVGLPAGVKFDPTDQELIEHLEAKVVEEESKSHPLIDEFIPTIEGEDGICYTHPEKLPGVTRDGLSKHFFHRPSKAYTTGTRKRRKIQTECDIQRGETRWHKTGKTRPVMVNGKQKGCKKILVLYTNFGKHRKPEKTNWVMHQYHLGEHEEEREGELVVSKIFYQTQPRQCSSSGPSGAAVGGVSNEVGGGVGEHRRDSTGSGSCSSSKEVVSQREHEVVMSGYSGNMQPADNFSFAPFRKTFEEVGIGEVQTKGRDHNNENVEDHEHHFQRTHGQHHHHHDHQAAAVTAAAAFQISRPTNPISGIISSACLHQSAIVLHDDPFQVSRMLLQTEKFQQQQQQQQHAAQQQNQHPHQKPVERSAAGLEELIMMGCTSAGSRGDASTIPHPQETEWLKYYWPPDNPDHHG